LPANTHVYLCPQTLFKFHPEFDQLLAGILRRDAQGLVVLLEAKVPEWTELLRQRYDRSIADVSSRIRFLPTVTSADFLSLIAASDVMLDTVHFNGMNTSLEAFSLGTPVVTWPSNLQRGRHTSGMYAKMGLDDCIARSLEDYVAIAVRLACEPGLRLAIGNKIRAASHALFEDSNVVREFERFFVHAVAQAQPSPTP
jgi:predicted O-linked N-acetylglucosamine transferase (SPINDLY family)